MQSWSLERKIRVTQSKIIEWYERWEGKVYVSFSGGKDSTVLLDLARRIYPDISVKFINTGLEYPEIQKFAETTIGKDNWLHPERYNRKTKKWERYVFSDVIKDYGYPVVSKEQSAFIQEYRDTKSDKLKDIRINGNKKGQGKISKKWMFLVDAPFLISDKCCDAMKKRPALLYEKKTGHHPIIGTTAGESSQRKINWFKYGCNAFDKKRPTSQPMSFWTDQDVIKYLIDFNIDFAEIYGEAIFDGSKYFLTGEPRTGCMFCMFGAHCEGNPNKFQRMKNTHPKQYDYCIRPTEENGLGLGEVLDYIGVPYQ